MAAVQAASLDEEKARLQRAFVFGHRCFSSRQRLTDQ